MLRIEKTLADGDKEIIEGDGYVITLNTKPDKDILNCIGKIGANRPINVFRSNTYDTSYLLLNQLLTLGQTNLGKVLDSGAMYCVNSQNDVLGGIIPPQGDTDLQGVVGAVELDWVGYSGSHTKRGTINLEESSISNNVNSYKAHIVIDFPTHACNGTIDTIYFSPIGLYNNDFTTTFATLSCNNYVAKPSKFLGDCRLTTYGSVSTTDSLRICATSGLVGVGWTGIVSSSDTFCNLLYTNSTRLPYYTHMNLGNLMLAYRDKLYYFFCGYSSSSNDVGNAYKVPTDSAVILKELTVNTDDNGDYVIMENKVNVLDVFKLTDLNTTNKFNIYYSTMLGDITMVSYGIWKNSKAYHYLSFVDKNNNEIKCIEFSPVTRATTFTNGVSTFYAINSNIFDKNFNIVGDGFSNTFPRSRYGTNGIKNFMALSGWSSFTSTNTGYYPNLFECATSIKPIIKIDLAEPLTKNNAETLKLIFDFDIKIE